LYGFSLLYGYSGQTQIAGLGAALTGAGNLPFVIGILLVVVGFGFKLAAVPFHFWSPDVYEGAPAIVAGFLSTASKAAGFVVLLRFMGAFLPVQTATWTTIAMILAALSMTVGNLLALVQKNFKRMLAYSSIAQAGYVLVGVAGGGQLGGSAVAYYLAVYLFANIAAFAIISILSPSFRKGQGEVERSGSEDIASLQGLHQRSPGLALVLLVSLLSLAGIPPFGGFVAKLLVFNAAVQGGWAWLAGAGLLFERFKDRLHPSRGERREGEAACDGNGCIGDLCSWNYYYRGYHFPIIELGGSGCGSGYPIITP
jgi:NADH-quinone oxidoreductase subunit N